MDRRKERIILVGVVVFAAVMMFWALNWGLPYLYHDDEQIFVKRALRFASGDMNPHFFFYPTLQMYLLFVAYGLFFIVGRCAGIFVSTAEFAHYYIRDPSAFYIIGRSVSAAASLATVYVVYKIARKIYADGKTALLAALALAAVPNFVASAHNLKSDPMMLLFLTLYFSACLEVLAGGNKSDYLRAGAFFGLAVTSKYNAAALAPVIFLADYFRRRRAGGFSFRAAATDGKLSLFTVIAALAFTAGTPFWLLDFTTFARHIRGMIIFTGSDEIYGTGGAPLNYLRQILFLGGPRPLLGAIVFAGLIAALSRRKNDGEFLAAVSALLVYVVCARQRIQQWQYLYPAYPFFVILAAGVLRRLSAAPAGRAAAFYASVFFAVATADAALFSAMVNYAMTQKDARTVAKEWIEQNIPPGGKILLDPRGPQLLRSKYLIRKQYELAMSLGNPKKDYFKLLLDAQRGVEYEHFHIARAVVCPPEMRDASQSVELAERADLGADYIRKKGFKYVVIAPPRLPTEEEKSFDADFRLIKEFSPRRFLPPQEFRVKIYEVTPHLPRRKNK